MRGTTGVDATNATSCAVENVREVVRGSRDLTYTWPERAVVKSYAAFLAAGGFFRTSSALSRMGSPAGAACASS